MKAWTQTRLRYVADINPAVRADLLAAQDTAVSFLPMEAIGEDGSLDLERTRPVAEVRNGYSYFEDGDVAFAKVTPCFENGKGALMRGLEHRAGFGTTEITVLRPKSNTDPRYLHYILQGERFRQLGAGAMTGAGGLKRVPDEFTRDFSVEWPKPAEQAAIANFLDKQTARIEALIAAKVQLLTSLEEFYLSTLHKCVSSGLTASTPSSTGDEWFPNLPDRWSFCALNYRYEIQLGKMLDERQQTGESRMPYLRNIDVRWDRIDTDALPTMDVWPEERERYTVRTGDLLVCEGGVGVGRAAIWNGPDNRIAFQKALHRVRPRSDADLPRFLFYLMRDCVWRDRVGAQEKATIPHLTAEAFRRWRFPFPPRHEQREIMRFLDEMSVRTHELSTHCQTHIDRLHEYRSSLISAAVTGQLDIGTFKAAA